MNVALLVTMAATFASTAIVSFGGIAAMIPEIHRQAVDVYQWMDNSQFAATFAISQIAPGPNILLMSLLGYRVQGMIGLLVATAATVVPTSLIALVAGRLETKLLRARWYSISRRSLPPIVVGLIAASGAITGTAAISNVVGVLIAVAVALTVASTKMNPLIPLAAAVAAGILAGRLGLF